MSETRFDSFAVVIPAYNEASTIFDIAHQALTYCQTVIIVDDGSSDNTAEVLGNLPVTLIQHSTNMGKAASLWDGMQAALELNCQAVITLDGDGQHSPDDIPRLISKAQLATNSIIVGSRLANKSAIPVKRYYANKIANFWISWAAGYRIQDSQSGYRLYPAELLRKISISTARSRSFVFESEILILASRLGYRSVAIPIPAIYAINARPSHFCGVRDITLITRMVAWDLITHGMNLPGLYRAWIRPAPDDSRYSQTGLDGYAMLLLSMLIILLSGGITLLLLVWHVYQLARTASSKAMQTTVTLVPGMRLQGNEPSPEYIARLERALGLLQANKQARVFILGGQTGTATISEAEAGRHYLVGHGISANRIMLEEHSRNTLENLKQARDLLVGDDEVTLVTNRYHLARCHAFANGFGITHHLVAAEDKSSITVGNLLRILKEAFHLHWYMTGKYWARLTNNKKILARIT